MTPSTRCPVLPPRPRVCLQLVASVLAEFPGAPSLLVSTLTLFLQLKAGSTGLWKPPGSAWLLMSLHQLVPASGVCPEPELSQLGTPSPVPVSPAASAAAGSCAERAGGAGQEGSGQGRYCVRPPWSRPAHPAGRLGHAGAAREGWEGPCSQLSECSGRLGPCSRHSRCRQDRRAGPEEALRGAERLGPGAKGVWGPRWRPLPGARESPFGARLCRLAAV